jgi:hypothetical protein
MSPVQRLRRAASHKPKLGSLLVARRTLLNLKELPLDRSHSRHQPIQFREKLLLIPSSLFDGFLRRAVTDPMQGIGQLAVEKPHVMLQVQEFLVKLGLLEHDVGSHVRTVGPSLSYSPEGGSSRSKRPPTKFLYG